VTPKLNSADYGPIPLVFGVTGHSDLISEDIPELEATVRQVFQAVQSRYPHSPLRLLSPLAEGADRLAATVALELGGELLVPLPMPHQEYEQDFATSESRQEFERLLGEASQVFELSALPEATPPRIPKPHSVRERQYEEVGIYVVRHSHFLLALWDGEDSGLSGGTSSIVQFRIAGLPAERLNPLDVPDAGLLFHIPARRQQNAPYKGDYSQFCAQARERAKTKLDGTWEGGAGQYAICCPKAVSLDGFHRIISRMDEFNREATEITLRGEGPYSDAVVSAFNRSDARVLETYQNADYLAIRSRAIYRRALIAIYCTGAATGLSYGVLGLPGLGVASPALAYAIFFLATVAVFQVQKKAGWFDRYLEYRALAEGLRVQRFWQIGGLGRGEDGVEAFDLYLRKQIGEIGWIRESLRALSCYERVSSKEPARQFIYEHWVKDQAAYFSAAAERDRLRLRRFRWITIPLYGVGLIAALTIRGLTFASSIILTTHRAFGLALRLLLLAPGLGGLVSNYSSHLALDEQEKSYRRMAQLFCLGKQKIESSGAQPDMVFFEAIIRALGSEALRENADWLHLHSTHPVQSPNVPRVSLPWRRKPKPE